MAREIIAWCDVHLGESEGADRIQGRPVVIALGAGRSPIQVDLCEQHEIDLVKPLMDVLTEYGIRADDVPVVPPKRRSSGPRGGTTHQREDPGEFKCPICSNEFTYLGTLRSHLRNIHQQTLADAEGKAAYTCKAPSTEDPSKPCGLGYESVQGLAVHLSRTHALPKDEREALLAEHRGPHVTNRMIGRGQRGEAEPTLEGMPPLPPKSDPVARKRERDRRRGIARRDAERAARKTA